MRYYNRIGEKRSSFLSREVLAYLSRHRLTEYSKIIAETLALNGRLLSGENSADTTSMAFSVQIMSGWGDNADPKQRKSN